MTCPRSIKGNNIVDSSSDKDDNGDGDDESRTVVIVLSTYGDESSDESGKRVFAVAGLVGSEADWTDVELQWKERLQGKVFHAVDCESDNGEFAGIDHQINQKLYADLTKIIFRSKLLGHGSAIDLRAFRKVFPDASDDNPYYMCFADVVIECGQVGRLSIPSDTVKFTFDRNTKREYNAGLIYDSFVQNDSWLLRKYLADELSFATRKTVGIQVADLLARETMKHLDNQIGPKFRRMRASMDALASTNRFRFKYETEDSLENLLRLIETIPSGPAEKYRAWLNKKRRMDNQSAKIEFFLIESWEEFKQEAFR